jgi:O-antigen/teichoic acid export membrane protein
MLAALGVGALLFLAGALAIVPIALFSGQQWAMLPAIVSLLPAATINLAAGYALGMKRVRYSTAINVAVTVVTLLFMIAGLLIAGRTASVAIVMWIAASFTVALVAGFGLLLHSRTLAGPDRIGAREFGVFAVKVGLVNLISLLNYRADLYIVALLTNPAELGMYTVAVSAAESLLVPTQVSALVTSPHIGSVDRATAARLTARCVRNNLIVALLVCGALFAFAHPIVRVLYGSAFTGVVPALRILLLGVVALSLGSPMSSYFTLKEGRPEVALWLAAGSAALCIGLSLILIPKIGMAGAATGSTAGYAVAQALAILYFQRETRTPLRTILIPTAEDFALYRSFLARMVADGRQLLHPAAR